MTSGPLRAAIRRQMGEKYSEKGTRLESVVLFMYFPAGFASNVQYSSWDTDANLHSLVFFPLCVQHTRPWSKAVICNIRKCGSVSLSPVWTCTFKYEWKWARAPLKPGVDAQTACSFRFKYCTFFFFPLLNNSYHMGWASASQLLNYKHSFDCKLNGKGCQLSLSSRGHTTRAPAVKNWHSCSERQHMLLLWAEQDLTLALLTPLLSQRGDGRDKSPTSEWEFTQRHVPALIQPYFASTKGSQNLLRKMAICAIRQTGVFGSGTCLPYWFRSLLWNDNCSLWKLLAVTSSARSQDYLVSSLNARTKLLWFLAWAEVVWHWAIPPCP